MLLWLIITFVSQSIFGQSNIALPKNENLKQLDSICNLAKVEKDSTKQLSLFKEIKAIAQKQKSSKYLCIANMGISKWKKKHVNITSGINSLKLYLTQTSNDSLKIYYNYRIGYYFKDANKLDSALHYIRKGIAISKKANNKIALVNGYESLGNMNLDYAKHQETLDAYKKADSIIAKNPELQNTEKHGYITHYIGFVNYSIYGSEKALKQYQKAKEIYLKANSEKGVQEINVAIAQIYRENKQYEKAIELITPAVKYNKKNGTVSSYTYALVMRAYIAIDQGNFKNAEQDLLLYQKIVKKNKLIIYQNYALTYLGYLYEKSGNYNKAITYYQEALDAYKKLDNKKLILKTNLSLINIFNLKKNHQKSIEASKYHIKIQEAYYDELIKSKALDLETKYQSEQKEQEIALLKSQNRLAKQQKTNQRNLLLSGIGLISLVSIIFFTLYRNRQKTNKKLRELDDFRSKMFNNLSHEFRTPLTVIQGLSSKLEQELTNYNDIENAKTIHKNASLLNEQLKQILAISSLEKSKLTTQKINDNVEEFVKLLTNLFSSYATSKGQHIEFVSEEKGILMDFDPEKLQSILQNLISNALKFNKENGRITVSTEKENTNLLLKVIDTGIGMEATNLTKIFERFYTSSSETNTQGTGIGLAYVKELVELANGKIDVESKINVGTTFTITLPITQNAEKPQGKIKPKLPFVYKEKNKVIIQPKTETSTDKNKTILTIEDNKDIQSYYKQLLNDTYNVVQAFNGKEAQNLLKKKEINLILCDLAMPEMDGFQFSKHLKQNSELSHIPLIIISANVTTEARTRGYQLGIDAYLTKPFKEKELLSLIRNLLKKQLQKASYFSDLLELKKVKKEHKIRTVEVNFIKKLQEFALENTIYSTEELAQKMAMSRSKLNQKVNALTEMSVANYMKHIKMEKAKELLKSTPLQINEIAFQLGYQDASLFSKVFKKVTGQSPSSYKDNL